MYNIPLGGGTFKQPWAIGGSGSTYVYGYCDATYREGWNEEQTIEFVKNSELFVICGAADDSSCSRHEPRRIVRRMHQDVCSYQGQGRAYLVSCREIEP